VATRRLDDDAETVMRRALRVSVDTLGVARNTAPVGEPSNRAPRPHFWRAERRHAARNPRPPR
jgi:hypothetical protein